MAVPRCLFSRGMFSNSNLGSRFMACHRQHQVADQLRSLAFLGEIQTGPAYSTFAPGSGFFASTSVGFQAIELLLTGDSSGGAGWPFLPLPIFCLAYCELLR